MVSWAKLFRPKHFAELTTITASRYRARASRPSAASSVASRLLLMPQHSPTLRGGEYPELNFLLLHIRIEWVFSAAYYLLVNYALGVDWNSLRRLWSLSTIYASHVP